MAHRNELTELTDDPVLLEVDARRRISLGALAAHDRYLVSVEADGVIVLVPAVALPVSEVMLRRSETTERVDAFLEHPETGVRRTRPPDTKEGDGQASA